MAAKKTVAELAVLPKKTSNRTESFAIEIKTVQLFGKTIFDRVFNNFSLNK